MGAILIGCTRESGSARRTGLGRKIDVAIARLEAQEDERQSEMSAVFRLGRRDDAEVLTDLLCSARREIGLDDHVCSAEKRDDLVKWIREKCYYSSVWTTDEHEALAILNRCANTKSICGIRHIVVRSDSRRKGIGTAIVRHIQNLGGRDVAYSRGPQSGFGKDVAWDRIRRK
jgi:hypothetical protein